MINKVYSIYDVKAEAFGIMVTHKTNGEAIRWFTDLVNNDKTSLFHHPEDYSLFIIGEYDDVKGKMLPRDANEQMSTALEVKKKDHLQLAK